MSRKKVELCFAPGRAIAIILLGMVGRNGSANHMRNGKTEIYEWEGKLASVVNYKDDLKSGLAADYYSNRFVADSGYYGVGAATAR